MTKDNDITVIETEQVTQHGRIVGTLMIVDHAEYGRLLIAEGSVQLNSRQHASVPWDKGLAIKIRSQDTLERLKQARWDCQDSLYNIVTKSYENQPLNLPFAYS